MNAPIKYFGGKGTMFNNIIKEFPIQGTYNTYVELFGGSFSVGLNVIDNAPVIVYNDLEQNVYSLYKVLSDSDLFAKFKEKCDLIYYSSDLRNEYKEKLNDPSLDILDRAFYFFYVNRTSHNGIGGFSINTVVRRNMCKSVSDMLSCIDRLPELHQVLSKCLILNQDGFKLMDKYNKNDVFMYLDPPYHHSTRGTARYKIDLNDDKQEEFLNLCVNSKAKLLISGYANDLYDSYLKDFNRIDFIVNTTNNKGRPKTKTEVLWKNY